MSRECGFEARERLGQAYWDDPRWKEVEKLNKEKKFVEVNSLVSQIRTSWGLEP